MVIALSSVAWDASLAGLPTPAVVVDVARVTGNLDDMAKRCAVHGIAFRPHAKTHKSVEVARRALAAGAVGITVATLSEAEVFASGGIDDIFIAYPVWAANEKTDRLAALNAACSLSVGVDSTAAVPHLAAAARRSGRRLRVLIELDSGEHRTGLQRPADAVALADAASTHGLEIVGVFTHGGHSYAAPASAAAAADDEIRTLDAAARALEATGHRVTVRSGGSTPTAAWAGPHGLTELRPGTFVFGDRQQLALGAVHSDQVALAVLSTVVSDAVPGQVVLDAGAKVLSKDLPDTVTGYGSLPAYPHAEVIKLYDHHALVATKGGPAPKVGDTVLVLPNHVCPVVNLAEELHAVEVDGTVRRWAVDARACNA